MGYYDEPFDENEILPAENLVVDSGPTYSCLSRRVVIFEPKSTSFSYDASTTMDEDNISIFSMLFFWEEGEDISSQDQEVIKEEEEKRKERNDQQQDGLLVFLLVLKE